MKLKGRETAMIITVIRIRRRRSKENKKKKEKNNKESIEKIRKNESGWLWGGIIHVKPNT